MYDLMIPAVQYTKTEDFEDAELVVDDLDSGKVRAPMRCICVPNNVGMYVYVCMYIYIYIYMQIYG
jgi:hypothetical protein